MPVKELPYHGSFLFTFAAFTQPVPLFHVLSLICYTTLHHCITMWILILQRLTLEFIFDFLYAPVWWYTIGLKRAGRFAARLVAAGNMQFAPGLWLLNIFVPMFGQYDWQGRLVSFFVRLFNFIIRSILLIIWVIFSLIALLLWIFIPIFVVYTLVYSF